MIEKNGKMSELLKEQVCDIENCLILTKKSQSIFPFSSKKISDKNMTWENFLK